MRLVGTLVVAASLLVGFAQAVAAIKLSMERGIRMEALKDR